MIKKSFLQLELDETFDSLGQYLDSFIAKTFSKEFSFQATSGEKIELNSFSHLIRWEQESSRLCQLLPFAKAFKTKLDELIKNNKIQNHFYLNYNIEDIDFPALILSSFANFYFTPSLDQLKIGVTLVEFKQFLAEYYNRKQIQSAPKNKSFLNHLVFTRSNILTNSLNIFSLMPLMVMRIMPRSPARSTNLLAAQSF